MPLVRLVNARKTLVSPSLGSKRRMRPSPARRPGERMLKSIPPPSQARPAAAPSKGPARSSKRHAIVIRSPPKPGSYDIRWRADRGDPGCGRIVTDLGKFDPRHSQRALRAGGSRIVVDMAGVGPQCANVNTEMPFD